jgi:hypothetical protein
MFRNTWGEEISFSASALSLLSILLLLYDHSMENKLDPGTELLAGLLESNMRHEQALFDHGLKIQAIELTLRSFPDTKPMYEQSLAALRTPELVQAHEHSQRLSRSAIDSIRGGQFPSD